MANDTTAVTAPPKSSIHDRYQDTGYVALCWDGAGGEAGRQAATAAHLKFVESILGEINLAGPLWDPSGTRIVGSFWCLRTKSEQRARELLDRDPYVKAGCYERIDVFPFLPAAGQYIGGKVW